MDTLILKFAVIGLVIGLLFVLGLLWGSKDDDDFDGMAQFHKARLLTRSGSSEPANLANLGSVFLVVSGGLI